MHTSKYTWGIWWVQSYREKSNKRYRDNISGSERKNKPFTATGQKITLPPGNAWYKTRQDTERTKWTQNTIQEKWSVLNQHEKLKLESLLEQHDGMFQGIGKIFDKRKNDKLQPHMIRACVDLRVPNKCMERNRILQVPVVEDFTCKFHDCKVFPKLDLRQGYHQLTLHPDSRAMATFSTPWGKHEA